ncbi:MAG TPA: c-type cytochrome [Longimicrobiales bacterium]|nr:c-type cytochrome [Longimicrobiales bacterium]
MRKWVDRLGWGLAAIVGLVAIGVGVLYSMSALRASQRHDVPAVTLHIPSDSAAVARGRHVSRAVAKCLDCHGDDYAGKVMVDDPAFGRLVAPNLTPAGVVADYTDADWVRAIRHGVSTRDRSLRVMPSYEYYHLSDDDLADLVAYLKTLPPATRELPPFRLGPIAHFLIVANKFPVLAAEAIDHFAERAPAPVPAETPEYGRYLADIGCVGCHGPQLRGGLPPMTGPDITPGGRLAGWTRADFTLALRAGKRPDNTVLSQEMPWRRTLELSDVELGALWAYLQELHPQVALRGRAE